MVACMGILMLQGASYGQTKTVDSLQLLLNKTADPSQHLELLLLLGEQRQSLHPDTLLKYATEAGQIARSQNNPFYAAISSYYVSNYLIKKGNLDSALQLCNTNQILLTKNEAYKKWWLKFEALKGQIFVKQNKYKDALAQYYFVLKTAEHEGDPENIMLAKNGIGWVNMEMNRNTLALSWFYSALQTTNNPVLLTQNGNIYSNIAAVYNELKRYDSAELFATTAIRYSRKAENLFFLANSLNILADAYINTNRKGRAEELLTQAVIIRRQIGDPFYIVSDISQLALFYASNNQGHKGIALSKEGIELAKKYGLTSKLPYLYFALAQNYRSAGSYQLYGETMEQVAALKDTVYAANSAEAMTEMEAKYNVQKTENIIIRQKLDLVSKNYQLFGSLIIFVLLNALAILLFKNYQARQKTIIITLREEEKRKAHEAVISAEENERRRIAADLHDNMGAYAAAISSNIAILMMRNPEADVSLMDSIKQNAGDIMGNLRDTIWILNSDSIMLTAVSDRFKNYIKKLSNSFNHVSIEIKEEIENDIVLSPEIALNTLRIMQEALNNALKHSKATLITVEITCIEKLSITIIDNGEGIQINGSKQDSYGLRNMQNRAKANGWQLSIKNGVHSGTEVMLNA